MYLTRYTRPEAVGYLVAQRVRCGRPNCRCARGEKHGPYWYLVCRRIRGRRWRQRKVYVPRDQVSTVRAWLERNKARDRAMVQLLRRSQRLRGAVANRKRGMITDVELEGFCNAIRDKQDGKGTGEEGQ